MRDPDEDIWVRRHIPGTLAQIPSQKSVDVLVAALEEPDGFLRYKPVAALETSAARASRHADVPARADRGARALGRRGATSPTCRCTTTCSARDSCRHRLAAGRGARPEDGAHAGPHLPAAGLALSVEDIAAARVDAGARRPAQPRERLGVSRQRAERTAAQADHAAARGPAASRRRSGAATSCCKTRPRDVEETLLQLINDDDQVVAAAPRSTSSRQQQIWSLADDIEHVLAHRDVRDWYVFEAASWALAEQRMPADRRRELWREPLPAAELAGRLRALPLFAIGQRRRAVPHRRQRPPGAARAGQQSCCRKASCRRPARRCSTAPSSRPPSEAEPHVIEPPAALGFNEALQGPADARADARPTESRSRWRCSIEELRTLLADNTDLVRGLFATLSERDPGSRPRCSRRAARRSRAAGGRGSHADREGPRAAARAALRAHRRRRDAAGRRSDAHRRR